MLRRFADITATLNPKTKPFESDMQQVGQCSASPESADISPSFDILHKKCATGRVRIVFLLGLARGGTTAIEKFLYERLPFDAQINEPSLLGPPEGSLSSAKSRVELTFKSVLAHVQRLEAAAAIAGQTEVTILIKEVTNKVLPEMIGLWARLSRWWLIVVRNPMLQVESRLKSMLDRIDSGALEEHGLRVDAHAAIMRVHGQLLFAAPEELRPVDTWRVAYNEMKRKRDLSNLGVGAMRAFTLHPFCMWPESQRAMLGGESISNDFSKLSEAQVAKIVDWRLGWTALATQLVALELSPVCPEALVVDFSSVQMDGGAGLIEWLEANVFIGHPSSGGALKEKFEACANSQLWSEADWAKWYASPCFEKALRSRAIEPVSKRPLGLDKLPAFLRPAIRAACNQWADLVSRDLRALPPPRPALRAPFIGLDPLHDAVCAAATGPGVALRRLLRRPARWRRRQRDIDLALSRLEDDDTAHRTKGHRALELVAACLVAFAQACMLLQCSMAYFWEHRIRIIATPWLLLKRGEYPIATDALLSVIVPAHNEATTVSACVRALLDRAKHKKNIEIIVVDAGSTDGTRQVVEQDFLPNNKHMLKIVDYVDGGGRGEYARCPLSLRKSSYESQDLLSTLVSLRVGARSSSSFMPTPLCQTSTMKLPVLSLKTRGLRLPPLVSRLHIRATAWLPRCLKPASTGDRGCSCCPGVTRASRLRVVASTLLTEALSRFPFSKTLTWSYARVSSAHIGAVALLPSRRRSKRRLAGTQISTTSLCPTCSMLFS